MIDIKDLRIGNYVKYNGFTCVVHSIKQKESRNDNFNDKDFVLLALDGIIGVTINNIEPIPLTEQSLIDFGFSGLDKGKYTMILSNYNFVEFEHVIAKNIKYVHTLQNLYHSLTGEELTKK